MQDRETWDDRYDLIGHPYLRLGVVHATGPYLAGVASAAAVILATGAITITLPAAASNKGKSFWIKNVGVFGATTIDSAGGFIDGGVTQTLPDQYDVMQVVSDGVAWFILSSSNL